MFLWCFKTSEARDEEYHRQTNDVQTSPTTSAQTQAPNKDNPKPPPCNTVTRHKPNFIYHERNSEQPRLSKVQIKENQKQLEKWQQEFLDAHNKYRAKHGVEPLKLSKHLITFATEWADHLANNNLVEYRKNIEYGENIAHYIGLSFKPEACVKNWYDEIRKYNFERTETPPSTYHFTQVVWKKSKKLGVGLAVRKNNIWIVCNYNPRGNVTGEFFDCVPRLLEDTTLTTTANQPKPATVPPPQPLSEPSKSPRTRDSKKWSLFELECLESHNKFRAMHGCSELKLNRKMCDYATDWSKILAKRRILEHRQNNKYGENLFYSQNTDPTGHDCVKSFYDEIKSYNYANPGFSNHTGHFTAVIWKDTTELGVGKTKIGNETFIVFNYSPAGNILNYFKNQVPPPLSLSDSSKPFSTPQSLPDSSRPSSLPQSSKPSPRDTKKWSDFELQCLESHNKFRAMHGCPALELNRKICDYATDWSKVLAKSRVLDHRKNNKYGENLYYSQNTDPTGDDCVKSFYNEIKFYNFSKPGFSNQTGHFSAVIWKDTKELGVGKTKIGNETFVVFNYSPAGNILNNFKGQVPPPLSLPDSSKPLSAPESLQDLSRPSLPQFSQPSARDSKKWSDFELQCLESHNKFRALHGCPELELNKKICVYATEWSKILAKRHTLDHRKNNKYGENLYYSQNYYPTGDDCVKSFYDEIKFYNFSKPGFSNQTGHFTAIIWKDTKELGVGKTKIGDETFIVFNYSPAGNILNYFKSQVPPPLSLSDSWKPPPTHESLPHSSRPSSLPQSSKPSTRDTKKWSDFEIQCLESHNKFRAMHGCPELELNKKICNYATDWSKVLAKRRTLDHRQNNKYGENLYYSQNYDPAGDDCVRSFYDEIKFYNFSKPGFSNQTGHFTAVIWKDTKELGVGKTKIDNETFVVFNYSPAGNILNYFKGQVPPPLSLKYSSKFFPTTQSLPHSSRPSSLPQSTKPSRRSRDKWSDFELECLESHNKFRSKHGCPGLELNRKICDYATDWSKVLSKRRNLQHRQNNKYGENLYYSQNTDPTGDDCVKSFYDEIKFYNFSKPGFSSQTGHFTAVIWKNTKELGVGKTKIDNETFVVFNYSPAGNILNYFEEQVPRLLRG